jgi:Putative transposase of IS4/5 family (DUF4096)
MPPQCRASDYVETYYLFSPALKRLRKAAGHEPSGPRHELAMRRIPSHMFDRPRRHRGRPRADDRKTLNGILYVLRTGCRWQDVPREYGSPATCWRRLKKWEVGGTWEGIWRKLPGFLDGQEKLKWTRAFLDGSFVPAKRGSLRWQDQAW